MRADEVVGAEWSAVVEFASTVGIESSVGTKSSIGVESLSSSEQEDKQVSSMQSTAETKLLVAVLF